uniref:Uncharacterized protein n=1 Tax=Panagrolaimus superbus TaxID=310955 RepID=A0A914YUP9_9BILA
MAENNLLETIKIPSYPPQSIFPSDVLKWMKYNALKYPRQALKLMQMNKYFIYNEFPYFCIQDLVSPFIENNDEWFIKRLNGEWESGIEFNDLPNNIWLTDSLIIDKINFIPQLLSKIIVFDIKELSLTSKNDYETMHFSDFKILTSNGFNLIQRVYFTKIIILDEINDEIVPFDEILDQLPNVTFLSLNCKYLQSNASKIIPKLILSKLQRLILIKVPDSFDFETLLNALKEKPDLYVRLNFKDVLSMNYCSQLQQFIDKIIDTGLTEYFPPRFDFPGITHESSDALKKLRRKYKIYMFNKKLVADNFVDTEIE